MTIFEEKINNYLVEANRMLKNTKSRKLSSLFYNDISVLLTVIYNNGLDVDVDSIFQRSDLIFDSTDSEDKFVESFLKSYIEAIKVNNKVGDLGPYFYNKYGDGYYKEFRTLMNIEDSIDLCHRFFEFYDKDLADYFNHILKHKNLAIGGCSWDDTTAGCTFSLVSQCEPFIIVNQFKSIYLPYVITHEVIHDYIENAFNDKTFEKTCIKESNRLDEVYSRFIELVFTLFLEEIHFNKNDIEALNLCFDNSLIDMLNNYNFYLKNVDVEAIVSIDELFSDYVSREAYSYGGVLAYHYFDDYLRNPERCKDNITNFSLNTMNHDKLFLLNNYGLKEENLGKSRVLSKHMKNHFKY